VPREILIRDQSKGRRNRVIHSHHFLPLWFLVLSLFLPRVALFIAWFDQWRFPIVPIGSILLWIFLPRGLVLIFIYLAQGLSLWFLVHLIVALLVWSGGTHRFNSYRNR
jgi:hypothetical protein